MKYEYQMMENSSDRAAFVAICEEMDAEGYELVSHTVECEGFRRIVTSSVWRRPATKPEAEE